MSTQREWTTIREYDDILFDYYNGIAKSFCTCWNEALSVVKKHIWQQQPNTLPFSLWFPKLIDLFKQKSKLLEYLYRHVCDYNQNRMTIETNIRRSEERRVGK